MQAIEFTLPNVVWDLRVRFERRGVELRAQDIAQRIALEDAADEACKPMHVLQDAIAVIRGADAKIRFEAFVPGFGQVFDSQLAFQHLQLEVEAQHDVQVVGHLVGVGADERALDLVDRAVESLQ